ncbi:uncharacterized protein LOC108671840 [Hyalella azteca]|uniref:Uncharacterized protein LOC108671840 n=1 Tax=Hyalella azteca TaxID=294128 RepID=A0A8B7NMM0_HYAAZ|nr:uncharacterized protein LOC108671840 [Hyalella azteca]
MGGYGANNRRDDYYDESGSGLRMIRKSGIPFLYVLGLCSLIVGMICLGIITAYWAGITHPMCFLYAQSPSYDGFSIVYKFGSNLSNCYWVAYGAVPSAAIGLMCGVFYMMKLFGDPSDEHEEAAQKRNTKIILVAMSVASLLLLAVCCTLAEGMRVTCTNMGINAVNGKADNCYDKLDLRVAMYNLPVDTSSMIHASSGCLWTSMVAYTLLVIFHSVALCRFP